MEVKLLTSTTSIHDMEQFAAIAALTCHGNADKEFVASDVLKRIIKAGHESVLEHITLTYSVKNLSRACLQELARHRHISLSVESTRHTLWKVFDSWETLDDAPESPEGINDYPDIYGIYGSLRHFYLSELRRLSRLRRLSSGWSVPNDKLKYYLPEFWPTNLILTSNIRELRHIIKLRTAPAALEEFRDLAYRLYHTVPEEYRYLLEDCVYKKEDER